MPLPEAMREAAPAKINLALHVRARRDDGYHELDTLFAFCEDGDWIEGHSVETAATGFSLAVDGPFAEGLGSDGNLVEDAWARLAGIDGTPRTTTLRLDKRLPVASGLGGGSADAAATLRLLTRLWGCDPAYAEAIAPTLGADVPACLASMTARGTGIGTDLAPVAMAELTGAPVLLVNPRVGLSTAAVFARWDGKDRGPLENWREGRNDLEAPARALVPAIGAVLDWLAARPGVDVARMSGSGATCFALFEDTASRDAAAAAVPDKWWHLASKLR